MITTRSPFGTQLSSAAPTITPASYSMMEVINSGNASAATRFWKLVAPGDGAIRADVLLSHPGPRAYGLSSIMLNVYEGDTSPDEEVLLVPFAAGSLEGNAFMVEDGKTYWIMTRVFHSFGSQPVDWGVIMRLSSFQAAEPAWHQVPEREVKVYLQDPEGLSWDNIEPDNPWDRAWNMDFGGGTNTMQGDAFIGNFTWNRSFHGLDPISGIPGYLAVTHAWQSCCSYNRSTLPITYAAPGLDGTTQGVPPEVPYYPAYYRGPGGTVAAYNTWDADENTLPPFQYASSSFSTSVGFLTISLTKERWLTGPMVGWTEPEMIAFAGYNPSVDDIAGVIIEDELPEIRRVKMIPDWSGQLIGADNTSASPVQWYQGITRFDPDLYWPSGGSPPGPIHGWGPIVGAGSHPQGDFIQQAQYVFGDTATGKWPRSYINEMGMDFATTGIPGNEFEVPQETWLAALEVEDHMGEVSVIYDDFESYGGDSILDQYAHWAPYGLTFVVGTSENLAEYPVSPGLPVPSTDVGIGSAKGLYNLWLWPKITYRPSRFKVALAPPLEPVGPYPWLAGPQRRVQEFEPIAHD